MANKVKTSETVGVAYSYDPKTFEYLGEVEAQVSPLEKGVLLIPAFATDKKQLKQKSNKAVCFNTETNDWEYKDDYRGIYYAPDRTMVAIEDLGVVPGPTLSLEIPPLTPEEIKEQKNISIKAQLEQKEKLSLRAMRELLLKISAVVLISSEKEKVELEQVEVEIAKLRAKLEKWD